MTPRSGRRAWRRSGFPLCSQHLPNKTTRDCVQFYYLNKKTKLFKVLYKKFEQKNRKSYSLKNKYRGRDDSKVCPFPTPFSRAPLHPPCTCPFNRHHHRVARRSAAHSAGLAARQPLCGKGCSPCSPWANQMGAP